MCFPREVFLSLVAMPLHHRCWRFLIETFSLKRPPSNMHYSLYKRYVKATSWGILAVLTWGVTTKSAVISQNQMKLLHIRFHSCSRRVLLSRILSKLCLKIDFKDFWPECREFRDEDEVFNHHCFHLWLLAIGDGQKWEERSLSLHCETERKQLSMHLHRNDICHDGIVAESLPKIRGVLPRSSKATDGTYKP